MARRRSQNRRRSLKSINITELDRDSDCIDVHDPIWWKNMEGDTTMRQSRLSITANTTEPLLNDDSTVNPSEIQDEWWKKLDKTSTELSRRISSRGSIKLADTSQESLKSDDTEEISIKKKKVLLRPQTEENLGTENFLAFLNSLNLTERSESNQEERSKNDNDDPRINLRNRNRRNRIDSLSESDLQPSLNTSTETDTVVKLRPKPFKKRFTQLPDNFFEGISKISDSSEINKIADSPSDDNSRKNPMKDKANYQETNKSSLSQKNTRTKLSDHEDIGLMSPPKIVPRRKKCSPTSRKLDVMSDGSGSDESLKKRKLNFAKKKRDTASLNPFDNVIEAYLNQSNEPIKNSPTKNSSIEHRALDQNSDKSKNLTIDKTETDKLIETDRESISVENENPVNRRGANKSSSTQKNTQSSKSSDHEDIGLMGPPKNVSHGKNFSSDGSESDKSVKKLKLNFAKKKRETASLNPFDSVVETNCNVSNERINDPLTENSSFERRELDQKNDKLKNLTIDDTEAENLVKTNRKSVSVEKENSSNRLEISETSKNTVRKISIRGNSLMNRIKEMSAEVNDPDRLLKSSLITKNLEVCLTRISLNKITPSQKKDNSKLEENLEKQNQKQANESNEYSISPQCSFEDAAYELPNMERSLTPDISSSEDDNDKSHSENNKSVRGSSLSLRSNPETGKNLHEQIIEKNESGTNTNTSRTNTSRTNTSRTNTSRKSHTRTTFSHTKIFSDEDISIEDSDYLCDINERLEMRNEENIGVSRKSVTADNISQRNIESNEKKVIYDEENDAKETNRKSKSLNWKENSRKSGKNVTVIEQQNSRINENEETKKTVTTSADIQTSPITRNFKKSILMNNSRQIEQSDVDYSEDEPEMAERINSTNSELSKNSRRTRSSVGLTNKLQESNQNEEISTLSENSSLGKKYEKSLSFLRADELRANIEPEEIRANVEKTTFKSISRLSNSRSKRNSRTLQRNVEIDNAMDGTEKNFTTSTDSYSSDNSRKSRNTSVTKVSQRRSALFNESIIDYEEENARKSDQESEHSYSKIKSSTSGKSLATDKSHRIIETNESTSTDEDEDKEDEDEDVMSQRSFAKNKTQQSIQSEKIWSDDETENIEKLTSNMTKASTSRGNFHQSLRNVQIPEKINENEARNTKELISSSRQKSIPRSDVPREQYEKTNDEIITENEHNRHSSVVEKPINRNALTPNLSSNKNSTHRTSKINDSQKQQSITNFFPSKFLQKSNDCSTREIPTTFDKNKLKQVMEKVEERKKLEIEKMNFETVTKKTNTKRRNHFSTIEKGDSNKKAKIVDKAYIVNGTVYKAPKLPRPKPWVTDRLYRHLRKLMEPKYKISTRIKSEKFIQELAEVVRITLKRKKYESYKHEVDVLMKKMAVLGIIKTRNDFYDFCYDFMPYDFRVKVTPILLPGNKNSIPYDPKTLHTPILPTDEFSFRPEN